jgi:endo-alpha-1,4-polygalactosaminidase (GH114 family)
MKRTLTSFCLSLALGIFVLTAPANAQLRSQGKVLNDALGPESDFYNADPLVDYAEEMRKFIQGIAKYARQFKRDFIVIVNDSTGLLTQIIDIDQQISVPSSVFMNTLDGIIQPSLSFGKEGFGVPTDKKEQEEMLADLQVARDAGLKIFTIDYTSKPKDIDTALRFSMKHNFIPYVAPGMGFNNNKLPNWPKRPLHENPHTISSAKLVKNYVLINDSSRIGNPEEYAMKMHNTNYDMIVTNVFHHRAQVLGPHNVRTMQFKKLGARRPVLAQMNIGTAYAGAYYWKPEWRMGNPPWLLDLAPNSSDRYLVKYWHPSWQQLIYGNNMSYLYGIIKEGYDGVVLNGAHIYELFANPE